MSKNKTSFLIQDIAIVVLSILIAIVLVQNDVISKILNTATEWRLLGTFITGMFFTSIFTVTPAVATFSQILEFQNIWVTALIGALGAVAGDLLIFRFVRDRLSEHIVESFKWKSGRKMFHHFFKFKLFRWSMFLLGGLIIASPLPDELGVSLLGLSKMKTKSFVIISYVFNFIGIILVGVAMKAFVW